METEEPELILLGLTLHSFWLLSNNLDLLQKHEFKISFAVRVTMQKFRHDFNSQYNN